MAKLIKTIHDRINFAIKKGHTGHIPPDQIDNEIHAESMNLWKKYVEEFERTSKIAMFLNPFKKTELITLTSGSGVTTNDNINDIIPISVGTSSDVEIDILSRADYLNRINHPIKALETEYPICLIDNGTISVLPNTISSVRIYYLRPPIKPEYKFTVSGDRYIYDDANSTDIEWDEVLHDEIMNRVLANLGINMREEELIRFSQIEKQQEGT